MPTDFNLTQIIYLVTAFSAVAAVASFLVPVLKRYKRANRIKAVVARHRGNLSQERMENLAKSGRPREAKGSALVNMAQKIVKRLKLEGLMSQAKVKQFLAQGGFRGRSALAFYALARIVGIPVGTIAAVVLLKLAEKNYPFIVQALLWGVGGVIGFYIPRITVTNAANKRRAEIGKAFPDALDLMVICVETGLSIEATFDRITQEISGNSEILAQEMGLATAELAYLGDRSKAYQNFADRTGLPAARSLATTLIQTERYGTPVSLAVKVLAAEKRQERMSAAEKKAATLPATLTVPMILFFLPVLFLVVIGPAIIQMMAL